MYKRTINRIEINSNYKFDGFVEGEYDFPNIQLYVRDSYIHKPSKSRLDNWFYGVHYQDRICFEDSFCGLENQIVLSNLNHNCTTKIEINKNVLLLDKIYPPRSRRSFHDLLHAVIRVKLIQKGYATLHAATLANENHGVLLLAYPNVGKSLSTMQLLQKGYKYLSDDAVHVNKNGNAYLTKFSSAIGYNDFLKYVKPEDIGTLNYYKKLINSYIISKNKMLERVMKHSHIVLGDMFETQEEAKIDTVCVLELGSRNIKKISSEEFLNKRFSIDGYSLGRFDNPFLFVYDYFNNSFSIKDIEQQEQDNIRQFLTGADCYRLSCNNWDWIELLQEIGL